MLLIPVVMMLDFWDRRVHAKPTVTLKKLSLLLVFAAVAFTAWAAAMPDTPFLSILAKAQPVGGICVIVLALVMYKVASIFDLVPPPSIKTV